MARVFIDPHMFSTDWFVVALKELIASSKVIFLFANCDKGLKETQKVRKALEFRKIMTAVHRATAAPKKDIDHHMTMLTGNVDFVSCKDCDDPHIMAAIFLHPTKYVFSKDARMAKCRKNMVGKLDKRYCKFIVISTNEVYIVHKPRILNSA
jgi:hypothetical protein